MTDLGLLPGRLSTSVYGNHSLNNAGEVVGHCNNGDLVSGLFGDYFTENVAFRWTSRTGIQPLPLLPGKDNATGYSLNDRGQIIGIAGNSLLDVHAVLWARGTVHDLGVLPGDTSSFAQAINNPGQIVGASGYFVWDEPTSTAVPVRIRPVLWRQGQIGLLPMGGLLGGQANDINDEGQIAGNLFTQDAADLLHSVPVLWSNERSEPSVLGSLGGEFGFAWDLNNRGQIVGQSQTENGTVHAFLWQGGVLTDLGTRGGGWASLWALNNRGQAVGEATDANEEVHAVLVENGVMHDLNERISPDLGWILVFADGINDRGQISGTGLRNTGGHWEVRGFLLTPRKL